MAVTIEYLPNNIKTEQQNIIKYTKLDILF